MEQAVGGLGIAAIDAQFAQALGRGAQDFDLLAADTAVLASMGIEAGHGDAGALDAEVALNRLVRD